MEAVSMGPFYDGTEMRKILFAVAVSILIACGRSETPSATAVADSTAEGEAAHLVVDAAIAAHGGFEALKAAATWVGEIRRFQRGDSYVVTNRYRPGMVRLEQDLGNGDRSVDVIGDPHCWGLHGPASIPCSMETRENDRPRVIMEMAAQLWPLKEEEWVLLGTESVEDSGDRLDVVRARYLPRDTEAEFAFDGTTRRLRSISVRGVKGGVLGTHLHVYSQYAEYCGVRMPSHNVKSFEGEVWVEEDILELTCEPVEESLFLRPPQVAEGTTVASRVDATTMACAEYDHQSSTFSEAGKRLHESMDEERLAATGPLRRLVLSDGRMQICADVPPETTGSGQRLVIQSLPAADALSIFSLRAYDGDSSGLAAALRAEAVRRNLEPGGPMRLMRYDNDGMGPSGELVVELQLPVVAAGG